MKRRTAKKQIKKYYKKYFLKYTNKSDDFCSKHFPENYKEIIAKGLAKEINYLLNLVRYNNAYNLLLFNEYKKERETTKKEQIRYIICDLVDYYEDNDYFYNNYEPLYM